MNDKIGQLLKNFNDLTNVLTTRISIIELYSKFHLEADHLSNLLNNFEHSVKTQKNADVFHYIDTVWEKIQAQFAILKSIAKLFATEKTKVCMQCTCQTFFRKHSNISRHPRRHHVQHTDRKLCRFVFTDASSQWQTKILLFILMLLMLSSSFSQKDLWIFAICVEFLEIEYTHHSHGREEMDIQNNCRIYYLCLDRDIGLKQRSNDPIFDLSFR